MESVTRIDDKLKALYCFRFDDETGQWDRFVIKDYRVVKMGLYRTYYEFATPQVTKDSTKYQVDSRKIDRYVSKKVFSFDDDLKKAKSIAIKSLTDMKDDLLYRVDRINQALEKMRK